MQWLKGMTIFVASCLALFMATAVNAQSRYSVYSAQEPPPAPIAFSLKMGGENTFVQGANVNATFGSTLEYHFFKTYSLGAEYSFYSPYTHFDDYVYNGANDLSFFLSDSELWANHYYGLNVVAKLSFTMPTSPASKEATINWATGQSLVFKKTFSDRTFVTYTLAATEYSVKYIEAYVDPDDGTIYYNTKLEVANRIYLSRKVVQGLTFLIGGGVKTYNNYEGNTYNIYKLSAGTSAELSKSATLDFAITSYQKSADADKTWNGPSTSDHFFDAKGTLFTFSMSIKI